MHLHNKTHGANHQGQREGGKEEARKRVGEGARKARLAIPNSSGFFISQPQPGQTAQPASMGNSQGQSLPEVSQEGCRGKEPSLALNSWG